MHLRGTVPALLLLELRRHRRAGLSALSHDWTWCDQAAHQVLCLNNEAGVAWVARPCPQSVASGARFTDPTWVALPAIITERSGSLHD